MQVIAGPAGWEIAQEIAKELNTSEIVPEYKIFPDGESYLRLPDKLSDDVLVVQSCRYPQDSNLFQLLNLVSTIKRLNDSYVTCYIPYVCYARADREVSEGEAISIDTVLHLLESVGIDHLITLDIHNPEVLERTEMRTTNILPSISMRNYLQQNLTKEPELQVIAPDEGAMDRAKALAEEMNTSFTGLQKSRDPESGQVSLQLGEADLESSEIVIVDDIISTGGTLVEASQLLKISGVNRIHYLITHALGTEAVDKLQEIGGGLIASTNSTGSIIGHIPTTQDLLKVLEI